MWAVRSKSVAAVSRAEGALGALGAPSGPADKGPSSTLSVCGRSRPPLPAGELGPGAAVELGPFEAEELLPDPRQAGLPHALDHEPPEHLR